MIHTEASPFQIVLYEGAGANALSPSDGFAVLSRLLDRGYSVTRVSSSTSTSTGLNRRSASPKQDRLLVLGDFGGNAPSLEDAAGRIEIESRDIRGLDDEEVLDLVEAFRDGQGRAMNQPAPQGTPGYWKPWFPVIDYDRCTNCMQCLSFCLFDVYGVDEGHRIQVQNQDNCKTNCPACSRVCPEVAIMFPKYASGPINGEPVSDKDVQREKMKVDISALLGGDIYSRLRDRSEAAKSRFSKERSSDKALNERKKCLTKLQQEGMIPADVLASIDLASLPSPDAIRQKAEEAARLAAEANKKRP